MNQLADIKNCTGCKMCEELCPKKAISFQENGEGFWYPVVDETKCIHCNLCTKRCPSLSGESYQKEKPEVYSAWVKDDTIRSKSASGGIYHALASAVLKKGGYLVGAVYGKDYKSAHHIVGKNKDDLDQIMGSKYFQSDTAGIYSKVQKLLDLDKIVLFCGTPCQCAALQAFLKHSYEKLYLVDFICRGINSPLAFRKHIEELEEQNHSKVKSVQLKNKKTGWMSVATYIEFENGTTIHQDKNESLWVKGFIGGDGLYIRESCYSCKYRTIPRISDLTIGDFWGIQGMSPEDLFKGISAVMVNSPKGNKLFRAIQPEIVWKERNFAELSAGNPALMKQIGRNENRERFFEMLKDHTFSEAVKENIAQDVIQKMGRKKILRAVKRRLKKIKFLLSIDTVQFVKYNYFSHNIVRDKNCYLIPYKNAIIDLSKDSRIYIKGRDLCVGINKLRGSKAETHLRMSGDARWYLNNGCSLFYDTVIEIKDHAVFEAGNFSANGGCVIICAKHIKFGEDIMLGRNIVIYDSDHHPVYDQNYRMSNPAKDVVIDDHVWLTADITVLKGVHIGANSIVTAQTLLRKSFTKDALIAGGSSGKEVAQINGWSKEPMKVS